MAGVHCLVRWAMTKEQPFTATFKLEKETKNTVRYAGDWKANLNY